MQENLLLDELHTSDEGVNIDDSYLRKNEIVAGIEKFLLIENVILIEEIY